MQNIVHRILEACGQERDLADSVIVTPLQKQKKAAGMRVKLTDKEGLNKLVPPKLQIGQIKNLLLSLCYIFPLKWISCLCYLQLLYDLKGNLTNNSGLSTKNAGLSKW